MIAEKLAHVAPALILNAHVGGAQYFALSRPRAKQLIAEMMDNLPDLRPPTAPEAVNDNVPALIPEVLAELPRPVRPYGGTTAIFTLDAEHRAPFTHGFDSYLAVTVNALTGYGALTWLVSPDTRLPVAPELADQIWLSDNPSPPASDPHVFADPCLPSYHHPRSTLPAAQIRAAVQEFCREATGHRPSCIEWAPGDLTGQRPDAPRPKNHSSSRCEDPWCEHNCGLPHPSPEPAR
ncbi:Imm1 family immunity protein [Spirillospora sp. NPDC048911]|uniref:Imm1 family immunity protein n=1 Tax=Spirillospora sp. NPDC048911 TaxID=3364527 RepID=UPI003719A169